ncbi:MAG TPA: tRNA uridine-5-carboxymethylaminomethyl(34) synthesis GTPase MnmE [Pyrinomonadaceae bacterium]
MSTIVALSTPRGRGAIGVIRLSGPSASSIVQSLTRYQHEFEPRKATLVQLHCGPGNTIIDEVLITYFKSPNSLTGEDLFEIACHGSPAVIRQVIDTSLSLGARLAGPGEFTLRALSNGKIDLAEAEAIRDLIDSQTEAAARQAARQLGGELSKALEPLKNSLLEVIVILESALEFVEDDLPAASQNEIEDTLKTVSKKLDHWTKSYAAGHLLHDGVKVAITGRPNVGKSSLFNKLVERDRAIVTDVPGTTRDTLTEAIDIGGIPVVLTDTAGLRTSVDDIETLGIARAEQAMSDADLILLVIDGSVPTTTDDEKLISDTANARRLLVVNKSDLTTFSPEAANGDTGLKVSAKTGEGIDALRCAILAAFDSKGVESGGLLITNARHHDLLARSKREVDAAIQLLGERRSEELILVPLHNGLRLLGEITGETTSEEILSRVFATFCIGK